MSSARQTTGLTLPAILNAELTPAQEDARHRFRSDAEKWASEQDGSRTRKALVTKDKARDFELVGLRDGEKLGLSYRAKREGAMSAQIKTWLILVRRDDGVVQTASSRKRQQEARRAVHKPPTPAAGARSGRKATAPSEAPSGKRRRGGSRPPRSSTAGVATRSSTLARRAQIRSTAASAILRTPQRAVTRSFSRAVGGL